MKACVVIPAYNEAATIGRVLGLVPRSFTPIVVDDGSTDDTAKNATGYCQLLRHEKNKGAGAAIKTGLQAALEQGFGVISTLNADLQHPPQLLPTLAHPLLSGEADAVFGSRLSRESGGTMPLERWLGNKIATRIVNFRAGTHYSDVLCGMRCYSPKAAQVVVSCREDGYGFEAATALALAREKMRVKEVAIPAIDGPDKGNWLAVAWQSALAALSR